MVSHEMDTFLLAKNKYHWLMVLSQFSIVDIIGLEISVVWTLCAWSECKKLFHSYWYDILFGFATIHSVDFIKTIIKLVFQEKNTIMSTKL